jgi:hypothetical protein
MRPSRPPDAFDPLSRHWTFPHTAFTSSVKTSPLSAFRWNHRAVAIQLESSAGSDRESIAMAPMMLDVAEDGGEMVTVAPPDRTRLPAVHETLRSVEPSPDDGRATVLTAGRTSYPRTPGGPGGPGRPAGPGGPCGPGRPCGSTRVVGESDRLVDEDGDVACGPVVDEGVAVPKAGLFSPLPEPHAPLSSSTKIRAGAGRMFIENVLQRGILDSCGRLTRRCDPQCRGRRPRRHGAR